MAAGGKADDADARGIDLERRGALAEKAESALGVLQGGNVFLLTGAAWHAVFHERGGDAQGVEPFANLGTFEIGGNDVVAAARENQGGGAGVFVCGRTID